jgi:cytochrome c oxidase subunit 1/cytochrome c oxidase subunit I+III
MLAAVPLDSEVHDTYFVVAHFHYVLIGGVLFPLLGALFFWFPKITGRMLDERIGQASFWLVFVGFNLTFFPMHIAGLLGMPRRVYTYPSGMGWDVYNLLSTIGSVILVLGTLAILVNVVQGLAFGPPAGPDPWSANTLEWSTSSPPPPYNFAQIPVVRSADPGWDGLSEPSDLVLPEGHQTPATMPLDADPAAALEMPSESLVPLAAAAAIALVCAGLIADLYWLAIAAGVAVALTLAFWHGPRETGPVEPAP